MANIPVRGCWPQIHIPISARVCSGPAEAHVRVRRSAKAGAGTGRHYRRCGRTTGYSLKRETVSLDENKTNDPRTWFLSSGVAIAMQAWRERYPPDAGPNDLGLVEADGCQLRDRDHLADQLRAHLRMAAVNCPQLFKNTDKRRHICARDTGATFATDSLANGKTETWESDRTGHMSSQMIRRYKRQVRMLKEQKLGEMKPLNEAIPEVSDDPPEDNEPDGDE